ncbi:FAD/NAD(P)-binding oxidoreductase [Mesorhizobium sp. BAC0120]|uniref:NAD(P)/FAD-dependent oxidoreductase n=1 Tax=Mesorhizobium sp. BAC0120 TaxID=3090670 RepID=UPI00298BF341|nr:FAD/NAD(P)-binding oxidoreductase [Mesorhizobium sp. BAC0120]MDW6023198.1 FAD/NAD(P)-binding oxidoreductase [Mesorhizobium sp. BAC0120]
MAARQRIVIAGGSLAGYSAATELTTLLPGSDIVWVTGEPHRTYSKPALSKEFMQGRSELAELMLPDIGGETKGLYTLRERQCTSLDVSARSIQLDDGSGIDFDQLLIATGASARMPDMLRGVGGVFSLRTLDDAMAIRARLERRPSIVVIGGGLIGCEMAASARALGLDVTIVERLGSLLDRPFGGAFGSHFLDLHRDNGVKIHMDATLTDIIIRDGQFAGVRLADGIEIEAGLALVGAGSQPCTEWLDDSSLAIADGILCDAYLAASSNGIFAAGDIARWMNPVYGLQMRVEHWTNASAQGRAAARNMAAATGRPELRKPFADVPYFWSDQYGQKIQMVGWHVGHDRIDIENDGGGMLARFYRDGRLIAAAGVNVPRAVMKLRRQIEQEAQGLEAA